MADRFTDRYNIFDTPREGSWFDKEGWMGVTPTQVQAVDPGAGGVNSGFQGSVFSPDFQSGMDFARTGLDTGGGGGGFLSGAFGKGGWGSGLLGVAQAGMGMYFGGKQLDLMKKQMKQQQSNFERQFGVQAAQINKEIADQAWARYRHDPSVMPDPDAYIEKHRVG